jgi:hypothetical protein
VNSRGAAAVGLGVIAGVGERVGVVVLVIFPAGSKAAILPEAKVRDSNS